MAGGVGQAISAAWYRGSWWLWLLFPLSLLFAFISRKRRRRIQAQWPSSGPCNQPPLIVVGNINVGGSGKTPLLVALVKHLQAKGLRPGVISRGHGSRAPHYPYMVGPSDSAASVGDEPLLIVQQCSIPLLIDPDRPRALKALLENYQVDIVLSDDGLQHYRLYRDLEIAVIDGSRGLGNGLLLPAGPLREGPERLQEVDWVISNGKPIHQSFSGLGGLTLYQMDLAPTRLCSLYDGRELAINVENLQAIAGQGACLAMAGIGNPERFFQSLQRYGLKLGAHPFEDHQAYDETSLGFAFNKPLLMTAKDGVKCQAYRGDSRAQAWWQFEVEAELCPEFLQQFEQRLNELLAN
ncbi:MAG: tetraacyldisaccharide 4'-kinase [Cellvibrionaceae bacterium]|nr:tetraacyldisaccharide 4'-kinase [Cellvibrionaceae bacterium]